MSPSLQWINQGYKSILSPRSRFRTSRVFSVHRFRTSTIIRAEFECLSTSFRALRRKWAFLWKHRATWIVRSNCANWFLSRPRIMHRNTLKYAKPFTFFSLDPTCLPVPSAVIQNTWCLCNSTCNCTDHLCNIIKIIFVPPSHLRTANAGKISAEVSFA